jgi:glycosyltransferase
MNLYLFNATDSAATYGIGTYLKELTHALDGSGIKIHVVHLHAVRDEFEIVKECNIEYWYVPEVFNQNTFSGSMKKFEDYCRNVIYLLRLQIQDTKGLIFHINYNHYHFFAKELKSVFDCRTVATVHFMRWAFELHGNISKFQTIRDKPESQRSEFENFVLRTYRNESQLYKEVDRVIALTADMKNFLCDGYQIDPDKIAIVPNGIADMCYENDPDRDLLRKKWHIPESESVILFAGRLHPMKGLVFLIRAFRKVLERIPDCRLLIAGSGGYEPYFQEAKEIITRVTFTGLLDKKLLGELYQIADIGVMPSLYEPFGLVAVEMMMHGLPVIASTSSGLNEVIDETSGIKVPIMVSHDKVEIDTDILAEKIIYLLEHPAEAREIGRNGRKRYLKEYSSEVFRRNMLNFYETLYTYDT